MLNTQTLLEWETKRDVAFTSDSRFFVTERNSMPTLVDAYSNRELRQYDIGEFDQELYDSIPPIQGLNPLDFTQEHNVMLAATFSNDDQWLYIATVDGKVYVFPSQLPTSHAEAWELSR